MPKLYINNGQRFGKIVVINESEKLILPCGQSNRAFNCICDCETKLIVRLVNLSRGRTKSCGCTHYTRNNECKSPIYKSYKGMIDRTRENNQDRKNYFDKGILVCDEWKNNFESFKIWAIENGFNKELELDRSDNSKGYSPENCRYVTKRMNINNRSCTFIVTYKGENLPFTIVLERLGLNVKSRTIRHRIEAGWNHDSAFDTPIRKGNYFKVKR